MEKLQVFLLVIQVIVALLMIFAILIQKSSGDSLSGIGGGSGGANSVISSKASANFITKTTMVLVAMFMINCLILALISSKTGHNNNLEIDKIIEQRAKDNSGNIGDVKQPLTTPNPLPNSPSIPPIN